jgi:DNA-binding transcriptional ArsR family regulator
VALSKRSDPFAALAHPIRREVLVMLRDEPGLSAGVIAGRFPRVSRAAVSRHLGVLRGAKLVRSRTRGRECHYTVNAEPVAAVQGWCEQFEAMLDGSLARLKQRVEQNE